MADKQKHRGNFTIIPNEYFDTEVYKNAFQGQVFLWLYRHRQYKPITTTIEGKVITIPVGALTFRIREVARPELNMNRTTMSKYLHQLEEIGAIKIKNYFKVCTYVEVIDFWNVADDMSHPIDHDVSQGVNHDVSHTTDTYIDSKDIEDIKDNNITESEEEELPEDGWI